MKKRQIVQIESPFMTIEFASSLRFCRVTMGAAVYTDLQVKAINMHDWEEPDFMYLIKVPCKAAVGNDYMVAVGHDAIFGYTHLERQPLIFHELNDENVEPVQLNLFGDGE